MRSTTSPRWISPKVDPSNYCAQMNETTCDGWPCNVEAERILKLPPTCKDVSSGGIDLLCHPRYTCKWVPTTPDAPQRIFSSDAWLSSHSGVCVKHECNLYDNVASIQ